MLQSSSLSPGGTQLSSNLKVALFTDADVFAGTERHMLDLALTFKSQGRSVSIACPGQGALARLAEEAGIEVRPIEKRGTMDLQAVSQLYKMFAQHQVDVVHAHNGRTALLSVVAKILARRGEVIFTHHFIEPARSRAKGIKKLLKRALHRWLNHRTAKIIAVSTAVSKATTSRNEVAPDKITVIPNGIREPNLSLSNGRPDYPSGKAVLVCVARLEPEKGHRSLVSALALLKKRNQDWICYFIGEGSHSCAIKAYVDEFHLSDDVVLLGFRKDVFNLIHHADMLVLPAEDEPFGLVLIEAMALAKPIVAVASGGPLEIVENGRNGLLVAAQDIAGMASALELLVEDPSFRNSLGVNGRQLYKEKFTADIMASRTWDTYLDCANIHRSSS